MTTGFIIGAGGGIDGGSGLELCDIGIALYVDETKGLRRYLNGQVVERNTNTEAFFTRLQEITTLHPSLLCTEDEWQSAKTLSAFGQVGKFVFNYSGDEIVSVRLPRVVNVQGLFDLQNLGMTVEAGLPIYGNSTTVQPEAIQYPYFIQIATGSETENNIINDIELNNPYSLFDSKYSDHELNNLSWLKSEGQWNAKAVYPTAYDKLLKVYNGTETVEGLSVKLSTEAYTDYDFVLNTANETFRLPLLDGSEDLPSDRCDYLELKSSGSTYTAPANGWFDVVCKATATNNNIFISSGNLSSQAQCINTTYAIALFLPVSKGTTVTMGWDHVNITRFRFNYAQGNGSLYFYVGETVQNANLIDAGRIGEQLANKVDINTPSIQAPYIKDTYVNGTSGYRIWSDGYCEQYGQRGAMGADSTLVITLLKPYKDTNYMIFEMPHFGASSNNARSACGYSNKTTSSFTLLQDTYPDDGGNWFTCGYIA